MMSETEDDTVKWWDYIPRVTVTFCKLLAIQHDVGGETARMLNIANEINMLGEALEVVLFLYIVPANISWRHRRTIIKHARMLMPPSSLLMFANSLFSP